MIANQFLSVQSKKSSKAVDIVAEDMEAQDVAPGRRVEQALSEDTQ